MNYIVGGLPRSGTSMMVRLLALSSDIKLLPLREIEHSEWTMAAIGGGYHPNPNGCYEAQPPAGDPDTDLWTHLIDNRLFKVDIDSLLYLMPGPGYQVVLMTRDPYEVQMSNVRAFGCQLPPSDFTQFTRTARMLAVRCDVALTVLDYAAVVADPMRACLHLRDDGWPINVEVAHKLVDPALYRNRKPEP